MIANAILADVAELADALDLGSSTARCEGSSPFVRIFRTSKGYSVALVPEHEVGLTLSADPAFVVYILPSKVDSPIFVKFGLSNENDDVK